MSKIDVIPTELFAEEFAELTANPTTAFLFCVQTGRPIDLKAAQRAAGVVTEVYTSAVQENGHHEVFATGTDMALLQNHLSVKGNPVLAFYMVRHPGKALFVSKPREALGMY